MNGSKARLKRGRAWSPRPTAMPSAAASTVAAATSPKVRPKSPSVAGSPSARIIARTIAVGGIRVVGLTQPARQTISSAPTATITAASRRAPTRPSKRTARVPCPPTPI